MLPFVSLSFRFKGDGEHVTPLHEAAERCAGFVCVLSRCYGAHWTATLSRSSQTQMRPKRRFS